MPGHGHNGFVQPCYGLLLNMCDCWPLWENHSWWLHRPCFERCGQDRSDVGWWCNSGWPWTWKWRFQAWRALVKQSFCAPVWGTSRTFNHCWQSSRRANVTNPSQTCLVVTVKPNAHPSGETGLGNERLYMHAQFVADVLYKKIVSHISNNAI